MQLVVVLSINFLDSPLIDGSVVRMSQHLGYSGPGTKTVVYKWLRLFRVKCHPKISFWELNSVVEFSMETINGRLLRCH